MRMIVLCTEIRYPRYVSSYHISYIIVSTKSTRSLQQKFIVIWIRRAVPTAQGYNQYNQDMASQLLPLGTIQ